MKPTLVILLRLIYHNKIQSLPVCCACFIELISINCVLLYRVQKYCKGLRGLLRIHEQRYLGISFTHCCWCMSLSEDIKLVWNNTFWWNYTKLSCLHRTFNIGNKVPFARLTLLASLKLPHFPQTPSMAIGWQYMVATWQYTDHCTASSWVSAVQAQVCSIKTILSGGCI